MSNHTNNTQRPSQDPNNAFATYINGSRVDLDSISPPSLPFPLTLNERVGVDPWLWSLPGRNLVLPSSMISIPRPRMQNVVFANNVANNTNIRSRPTEQSRRQHSELSPNEQRKALNKLKREIYNPTPKKIIQRLGKYYRQNEATKAYGDQKTVKEFANEIDDDDKRCAICLENFEPKEMVMLTPCNHMFHEDCILPWVKSSGKCPVCRYSLCGRNEENGASSTNNDNLVDETFINDLVSFVTSRGSSTTTEPFWF